MYVIKILTSSVGLRCQKELNISTSQYRLTLNYVNFILNLVNKKIISDFLIHNIFLMGEQGKEDTYNKMLLCLDFLLRLDFH